MSRVILQPAFVLHTRAFRDTSLIVDLFALKYGRISCLARGAKSSKSKLRGLLLPFVPLLVSWSGKSDLVTLSKIETNNKPYNITGSNLLSGLYLNELLVKLLAQHDPHPNIYRAYQNTLNNLQNNNNIQITLRLFEKQLLAEIGYGLQLTKDAEGQVIQPNNYYYYKYEHGFVRCLEHDENAFSGGIFGDVKHFSENRQKALLNMMFNLGYNKFTGFKKMIAAIKLNDWEEAAEQAKDSRWYRQVGKSRSERIITRLREG